MFTVVCLCMLCAPHWASKLLHYYTSWMKHRYRFWRSELVSIYFLNFYLCVRNSNIDNHLVLLQTTDLTPGGCPNTMLKFCTMFSELFSPRTPFNTIYIALHLFQWNKFLSYKNTPIELGLMFMYSTTPCFFIRLLLPSIIRIAVLEICF